MKKVVIVGSASLQEKILSWEKTWGDRGFIVVAYPQIPQDNFLKLYPDVYADFFRNITETDILFVMNEDKNGIEGYLGAESFAEMCFGVSQKLLYQKNIDIILLKMPSEQVQSYNEINLWLKLGWIKLYQS